MKFNHLFSAVIAFSVATVSAQIAIDQKAPDFTLKDQAGKQHTLSAYAGKTVVLEWINFDCPFVKKHYEPGTMPNLQKYYAEKGVVWLSICSSAKTKQGHFAGKELATRIEKSGWAGSAYLVDESGETGKSYGAKTTPHMYIISADGLLKYAGAIDNRPTAEKADIEGAHNYVKSALDEILDEKEVSVKVTKSYGCSVKY